MENHNYDRDGEFAYQGHNGVVISQAGADSSKVYYVWTVGCAGARGCNHFDCARIYDWAEYPFSPSD